MPDRQSQEKQKCKHQTTCTIKTGCAGCKFFISVEDDDPTEADLYLDYLDSRY